MGLGIHMIYLTSQSTVECVGIINNHAQIPLVNVDIGHSYLDMKLDDFINVLSIIPFCLPAVLLISTQASSHLLFYQFCFP